MVSQRSESLKNTFRSIYVGHSVSGYVRDIVVAVRQHYQVFYLCFDDIACSPDEVDVMAARETLQDANCHSSHGRRSNKTR